MVRLLITNFKQFITKIFLYLYFVISHVKIHAVSRMIYCDLNLMSSLFFFLEKICIIVKEIFENIPMRNMI